MAKKKRPRYFVSLYEAFKNNEELVRMFHRVDYAL